MYEIEIKILGINREEIEKRLLSLGAKKTFDGEMEAIYYDSADGSVRASGGALRLRREGGRAVLAFKKHVDDGKAKVRDEQEVEVSDFRAMNSILEAAGFFPWLRMEKHRTTYELTGVYFEFDRYQGDYEYIPEFLEIEGGDIETIYHYAEALGFGKQDCLPWDAVQLAEHYSGRKGKS